MYASYKDSVRRGTERENLDLFISINKIFSIADFGKHKLTIFRSLFSNLQYLLDLFYKFFQLYFNKHYIYSVQRSVFFFFFKIFFAFNDFDLHIYFIKNMFPFISVLKESEGVEGGEGKMVYQNKLAGFFVSLTTNTYKPSVDK